LLVNVIVAEAVFAGFATLCATTVTVAGVGKICGAVKLPFASTAPQPKGQAEPERDQRTAVSGCPPLEIVGWKTRVAPSSTEAAIGLSAISTSLAIVTTEVADFVASASLVAVTCTAVADAPAAMAPAVVGRSAGAVYTPSAVIVPLAAVPPGTPFTAHITLVLLVFATVAAKVCLFPRNTVALAGVTLTLIEGEVGGGGEGATEPAPTPAQPRVHALAERRPRNVSAGKSTRAGVFVSHVAASICGKGRMPSE